MSLVSLALVPWFLSLPNNREHQFPVPDQAEEAGSTVPSSVPPATF